MKKIAGKTALLIKLLVIVLLVVCIVTFIVKGEDSEWDKESKSVPYVAGQYTQTMQGKQLEISSDSSGEFRYDTDLVEKAEDIIDEVSTYKNSEVLERYLGKDKEEQKKFLACLIKAEYITQYPDLRKKDKIGTETADNEFQGCIQVKRANSDAEGTTGSEKDQLLEYMDYDTFMKYVEENNWEVVKNYFTLQGTIQTPDLENAEEQDIDNALELIVATYSSTDVSVTVNDESATYADKTSPVNKSELKVETSKMIYQDITDSFTMPFDMLWALLTIGEDKDFVYELAQLALKSKIVITVQDNLTTTVDTVTYDYKTKFIDSLDIMKVETEETGEIKEEGPFAKPDEVKDYQIVTVTTNNVNTVCMDVTYADTWLLTYHNSYANELKETQRILDENYNANNKEILNDAREYFAVFYEKKNEKTQSELKDIAFEYPGAKEKFDEIKAEENSEITYTQIVNKIVEVGTNGDYTDNTKALAKNNRVQSVCATTIMGDQDVSSCIAELRGFCGRHLSEREMTSILNTVISWYNANNKKNTVLINRLKIRKEQWRINQTEHETTDMTYNQYTQGTPTVREKTNTYSCYSTMGLYWSKHFENTTLLNYMNGIGDYASVSEYVTSDRKNYICYGEAPLNDTYNYAYGFKFKDGDNWADQIDQLRLLYQGIYNLQDTTAISDEKILKEFSENEEKYATRNESKMPVEIVDNAIAQLYMNKRQELYNDIESAKEELSLGSGIEEFTIAQLDVLTDRYYNGWADRAQYVKEIYKIVVNTNDKKTLKDNTELENLIKSNYKDKKGNLIYKNRDESRWITFTTGEYTIADGNSKVVLDTQDYKNDLTRDVNFLILLNEHEEAKNSIISGAEWLFSGMEKSPTASEQIDTMKWLLYKFTENSRYDVEEINWNKLLQKNARYKKATGGALESFIKVWTNYSLWSYENQESKAVPSKYITLENGKEYYKVYSENDSNKISYNIIVQDKEEGELVEQQEGLELLKQNIEVYTIIVNDYLKKNNIELSNPQRNALIALTYKYGVNYLENNKFAEAYNKGIENIKTNFAPFNGSSNESKAVSKLFEEGEYVYIDSTGKEIKITSGADAIIEAAKYIHEAMADDGGYGYCIYKPEKSCNHSGSCGLPSTFDAAQTYGPKNTCCATFVGWALVEAGYGDIIKDVDNINAVPTLYKGLMATGEFIEINSFDELEAGDLVIMNTCGTVYDHIQIYAGKANSGNSYYYNAGSRAALQSAVNIQGDQSVKEIFVKALRIKQ